MLDLLVGILHLVVFPGGLFALALGLFLKGCDRRVEARLQRRVGPPLIQPFLDLVKLSTKEVIIPTSAVRGAFLAAPVVALGGIAMCAALLPVPGVTDGLPKMGDLLVIFYLFPIPAMAIMLAGSSSGSPYGGIGFSREMIEAISAIERFGQRFAPGPDGITQADMAGQAIMNNRETGKPIIVPEVIHG